MLYILEYGLNGAFETSPEYGEEFMKKNTLETNQEDKIQNLKDTLDKVNMFYNKLSECFNIKYPLSKEIYGVESRNYKVQIPILMIISDFLKKIMEIGIDINDLNEIQKIIKVISSVMKDSYLENNFKGSSTRPELLIETSKNLFDKYNEINRI